MATLRTNPSFNDAVDYYQRQSNITGGYTPYNYSYFYTNGSPVGLSNPNQGKDVFGRPLVYPTNPANSLQVQQSSQAAQKVGAQPAPQQKVAGQSNPYGAAMPSTVSPAGTVQPGAQGSAENPFTTISNIKNPGVSNATQNLLDQSNAVNQATTKSFQQYLDEAAGVNKASKAAMTQESGAIGDIYDPNGLRSRLNSELNQYGTAARAVGNRAYLNALANLNARQMGAGSTGAGSYYNAQAMDKNIDINLPIEQQIAQQRLANEKMLSDYSLNAAGLRNKLGNSYLSSLLAPVDAQTSLLGKNIGNLGQLSQVDLANTFYGLRDPNSYGVNSINFGNNRNSAPYFPTPTNPYATNNPTDYSYLNPTIQYLMNRLNKNTVPSILQNNPNVLPPESAYYGPQLPSQYAPQSLENWNPNSADQYNMGESNYFNNGMNPGYDGYSQMPEYWNQ